MSKLKNLIKPFLPTLMISQPKTIKVIICQVVKRTRRVRQCLTFMGQFTVVRNSGKSVSIKNSLYIIWFILFSCPTFFWRNLSTCLSITTAKTQTGQHENSNLSLTALGQLAIVFFESRVSRELSNFGHRNHTLLLRLIVFACEGKKVSRSPI